MNAQDPQARSQHNPLWKPGDPTRTPESVMTEKRVHLDPAKMSTTDIYKFLIGSIVPRPIAFVSTVSLEGLGNLAPFSFFNGVSSNPPCLVISITRKNSGEKKDTLRNIEATREFVVNTVPYWIVEPMNACSAEYPHGVDEMQKVGLTPLPSVRVRPPRVKESPVHFECELHQTLEIGDGNVGSATLVVGRIVAMHITESAYDSEKGRIRFDALQPVARLGGLNYGLTTEVFSIPRPSGPTGLT